MLAPVFLPQDAYEEIIAHAREGKPEEVCGVLRGKDLHAYEAIRGKNVAADRVNNYEVDPQTLLLQFKFEDTGQEMIGIYHSHPISAAWPSATDAWNAHYPESVYLICSLEDDDAPVIRAFQMLTYYVDTHFPELDVALIKDELMLSEMRPGMGIRSHYQPQDAEIPPGLAEVAAQIYSPFYLNFYEGDDGAIDEARVITVREHPLSVI